MKRRIRTYSGTKNQAISEREIKIVRWRGVLRQRAWYC